jgi:hypothetical protein
MSDMIGSANIRLTDKTKTPHEKWMVRINFDAQASTTPAALEALKQAIENWANTHGVEVDFEGTPKRA